MYIIISKDINQNLEVYIYAIMVKTPDKGKHVDDLRETLSYVRR